MEPTKEIAWVWRALWALVVGLVAGALVFLAFSWFRAEAQTPPPSGIGTDPGRYVWGANALTVYNLDGSTKTIPFQPLTAERWQDDPAAALGSVLEWMAEYHPDLLPTVEARVQDGPRSNAAQTIYNVFVQAGITVETHPQAWQAVEYLR